MLDQVKQVIQEQLGVDAQSITADTALLTDLNLNSLELVELVCAFEIAFDIVVPEKDIHRFVTVGDIVAYLNDRLPH